MHFTDDDLKAYLAGALASDRADALEASLEHDTALEARLMELEPLAQPLRHAFKDIPDPSRLSSLLEGTPTEPTHLSTSWIRYALVACIAGVIGVAIAALGLPDKELTWQEQVAVYQALYVSETVASLSPTPGELDAQFERASVALGRPLDPGDYAALSGVTLKRAQILGLDQSPLVQIAFAAEDGTPIAFCITPSDEMQAPVAKELSGLPTVHWSNDGFGFMVIGDLPPTELAALARTLGATL